MTNTIVFLKVADNNAKVMKLCATVQHHFALGHRVLITVANDEAAQYLDQLLWRMPEESFLPHQVSRKQCQERIVITTGKENYNQAKVLLNLCPDPSPIYTQFETVYELDDETHPEKLRLSQLRRQSYVNSGNEIRNG